MNAFFRDKTPCEAQAMNIRPQAEGAICPPLHDCKSSLQQEQVFDQRTRDIVIDYYDIKLVFKKVWLLGGTDPRTPKHDLKSSLGRHE